MLRRVLRFALVFLPLALLLSAPAQEKPVPSAAAAEPHPLASFTQFSATLVSGLFQDDPLKVYRSGNLFRIDLENEFHVTDLSGRGTWVVRGDRCTHVPGVDARSFPFFGYRDHTVARSATSDKETIDSHICKVETFTFTPKSGPNLVTTMKLWEAEDLNGFPLKVEVVRPAKTMTFIYANVSVAAPDPKLFQLPAKCPDFMTGDKPSSKPPAKKAPPKAAPKPQS